MCEGKQPHPKWTSCGIGPFYVSGCLSHPIQPGSFSHRVFCPLDFVEHLSGNIPRSTGSFSHVVFSQLDIHHGVIDTTMLLLQHTSIRGTLSGWKLFPPGVFSCPVLTRPQFHDNSRQFLKDIDGPALPSWNGNPFRRKIESIQHEGKLDMATRATRRDLKRKQDNSTAHRTRRRRKQARVAMPPAH